MPKSAKNRLRARIPCCPDDPAGGAHDPLGAHAERHLRLPVCASQLRTAWRSPCRCRPRQPARQPAGRPGVVSVQDDGRVDRSADAGESGIVERTVRRLAEHLTGEGTLEAEDVHVGPRGRREGLAARCEGDGGRRADGVTVHALGEGQRDVDGELALVAPDIARLQRAEVDGGDELALRQLGSRCGRACGQAGGGVGGHRRTEQAGGGQTNERHNARGVHLHGGSLSLPAGRPARMSGARLRSTVALRRG